MELEKKPNLKHGTSFYESFSEQGQLLKMEQNRSEYTSVSVSYSSL